MFSFLDLALPAVHPGGDRSRGKGGEIAAPANITSLSSPLPVFTKNSFSLPSTVLVTLPVNAKPDPPCAANVVVEASNERAWRIAGSSFGAILVVWFSLVSSVDVKLRGVRNPNIHTSWRTRLRRSATRLHESASGKTDEVRRVSGRGRGFGNNSPVQEMSPGPLYITSYLMSSPRFVLAGSTSPSVKIISITPLHV